MNWKYKILYSLLIFFSAFGTRYLTWQDQRFDAWKTQENIAKSYRTQANFICEDGALSLFDSNANAAKIDFLLHPPGYPIVLAGAFELFGDSETTIQWLSMIADSFSAVLISFIVLELLSFSVALTTGLLAAFSPQFAGNSILLLPDVLSILPLLLAVYFLIKAYQKPSLLFALMCGALIGLSCWIRANALLTAPFFAVLSLLLLSSKRFLFPIVLISGAALVIAPITIRNWSVYHAFIPLSLGTGQTLLEGIGDYDVDKKFGMPKYDWEVTRQEAEIYRRSDYANNLIIVDGIERDRQRTARALKFIGEHPFWFAGVMIRRALWMLTPEKAQIISTNVPISRSVELDNNNEKIVRYSTVELFQQNTFVSKEAKTSFDAADKTLFLQTDTQKYGVQFVSHDLLTVPNTEYVLRLRLNLRAGRIRISVRNAGSENPLNSTVVDLDPVAIADEQLPRIIKLPFVSGGNAMRFAVANEAPQTSDSLLEIQSVEVTELGVARNGWTRLVRFPVFFVQIIYTLPVLLSLELIGLGLLAWRRKWETLLILFHVPLYYFFIQSVLHTEYRYVLAIHYFLFVLAAAAIIAILKLIFEQVKRFAAVPLLLKPR